MQNSYSSRSRPIAGTVLAASLVATLIAADGLRVDNPPDANAAAGVQANAIATNYAMLRLAQGSDPLENPSGSIQKFGLLSDGTRTEPDENAYLILDKNPGGPTPGFNYGRHFLILGPPWPT